MAAFAENDLYEPIGRWLKKTKKCQRFLIRTNIKGHEADVVGLRYEVDWGAPDQLIHKPLFKFHGFIIEVKKSADSQSIFSLRGEVDDAIRKLKKLGRYDGLHSYRIYMAYPADIIDEDTFAFAEERGVGILRLEILNNNPENLFVDEVLEAQAKPGQPIPNTQIRESARVFEEATKETGWLYKMLQRPSKLWQDLLGPAHREYDEKKFKVARIEERLKPKSVEINCVNPYLAKNMNNQFVRIFGYKTTTVAKVVKTSIIKGEMGSIFIDVSTSKSVNVKPGEVITLSDRIHIKGNSAKVYLAPYPNHADINYIQKVNVNELKRQLLGVPVGNVGNNDILSLNMEGTEITLEVVRIEQYGRPVTDTILISDQTELVKAVGADS